MLIANRLKINIGFLGHFRQSTANLISMRSNSSGFARPVVPVKQIQNSCIQFRYMLLNSFSNVFNLA